MTYVFQVTEMPTTTFYIFKTKKPVVIGDKVMFQTLTEERVHTVSQVWADRGLMKGYTAVGWSDVVDLTKPNS